MRPLPIILGVARSGGSGGGKNPPAGATFSISPALKMEILSRDKNRCRACGFTSSKYQEILHLNSDLSDARPQNLATVCTFCHQCFNLDKVSAMESGVLIWLPEIPQAHLNNIARAIYVARIAQGDPMAETARKALDLIMARRAQAAERMGTDDPFTLAKVLSDYLGAQHYKMRAAKLKGIRLFPRDRRMVQEASIKFNQFPQTLAYWRSKAGPFGDKPPKEWGNVYHDIIDAIDKKPKAA